MNKDNYIRLLEKENQEYFEKVMKFEKSSRGCCCHEIPELNDEINELLDDLNDMQADWAADIEWLGEIIKEFETQGVGDSESLRLFRAMEAQR